MRPLGFFGRESYKVQCARCHETLAITREEVEAGSYRCPVCNGACPIPGFVHAEYKQTRAREELTRQQRERRNEEKERNRRRHAARRARELGEREQQKAAQDRARQAQLERARQEQAARNQSLHTGQCPNCGGHLQVMQKGYDTGTGLACCCLGGPVGLLGGLLGSGQKTRVCSGCGQEFRFGSQQQASVGVVVAVIALVVLFLVLLGSC